MAANRLITRDDLFARKLPLVAPVPAVVVGISEAAGLASAKTLYSTSALPAAPVALRPGLAVNAEDTQGATSHEPAYLASPTHAVTTGDTMPRGTNAVVDSDIINPATGEAFATAAPGEGVRMAGHDLAAGRVIIEAGQRFCHRHIAVLMAMGTSSVAVRAPRVFFEGFEPWVERLLRRMAIAAGCRIDHGASPDLVVEATSLAEPVLAIAPGSFTTLLIREMCPVLQISPRFDSALAGFLMIGLPVIAHLSGTKLRTESRPLVSDIRGRSGFSTLALLGSEKTGLRACLIGEITLDTLLDATHIAILPPEREGYAAGSLLEVMALDQSLTGGS